MAKLLITGGAGFIGSHVAHSAAQLGHEVVVVDNLNDFYDPALKRKNLDAVLKNPNAGFVHGDILDATLLDSLFTAHKFEAVLHFAAHAGVLPSIARPQSYVLNNVTGLVTLLEQMAKHGSARLVFASSSSVYGSAPLPFAEGREGAVLSPYAATKRAGELLIESYSNIYGIRAACLRLFTVYGPRQRADLAIHKFTRMLRAGEALTLNDCGSSARDYTYISDAVAGVLAALEWTGAVSGGCEVFNIGSGTCVSLKRMVHALEISLGLSARIRHVCASPAEMPETHADIQKAKRMLAYEPTVPFEEGIERFTSWYDGKIR